jgi:hypothetical protein
MAFAFIASTSQTGNSPITTSAIDTTGADLIVLVRSVYDNGTPSTPTDNKSNTWTALTRRQATGDTAYDVRIWYSVNPTVGSGHTFTQGSSGAIYPSLHVMAFSGSHASPFDQESGQGTGSVTSVQAGSLTPSEGNCLVISGMVSNGGLPGIDGTYTESATAAIGGTSVSGGIAYDIQTTATATNPTWSWSGSHPSAAVLAVFKSAAGGGGGGTILPIVNSIMLGGVI